jgi:hypothetical protein
MEFQTFEELSNRYLGLLEEYANTEAEKKQLEADIQHKKANYTHAVDIIGDRSFLEEVDQLSKYMYELQAARNGIRELEEKFVEKLELIAPLVLTHNARRRGKRITYKYEVQDGKLKVTLDVPAVTSQVIMAP